MQRHKKRRRQLRWDYSWKKRLNASRRQYDSIVLGLRHPSKPGVIAEIELNQDQRTHLVNVFPDLKDGLWF